MSVTSPTSFIFHTGPLSLFTNTTSISKILFCLVGPSHSVSCMWTLCRRFLLRYAHIRNLNFMSPYDRAVVHSLFHCDLFHRSLSHLRRYNDHSFNRWHSYQFLAELFLLQVEWSVWTSGLIELLYLEFRFLLILLVSCSLKVAFRHLIRHYWGTEVLQRDSIESQE